MRGAICISRKGCSKFASGGGGGRGAGLLVPRDNCVVHQTHTWFTASNPHRPLWYIQRKVTIYCQSRGIGKWLTVTDTCTFVYMYMYKARRKGLAMDYSVVNNHQLSSFSLTYGKF